MSIKYNLALSYMSRFLSKIFKKDLNEENLFKYNFLSMIIGIAYFIVCDLLISLIQKNNSIPIYIVALGIIMLLTSKKPFGVFCTLLYAILFFTSIFALKSYTVDWFIAIACLRFFWLVLGFVILGVRISTKDL